MNICIDLNETFINKLRVKNWTPVLLNSLLIYLNTFIESTSIIT